jgi:hypothetical protein
LHSFRDDGDAGRDITNYLIKLLFLRGYHFNRTADFETVRQIKEAVCYVGYDLELEGSLAQDTTVLVQNYSVRERCYGFCVCVRLICRIAAARWHRDQSRSRALPGA